MRWRWRWRRKGCWVHPDLKLVNRAARAAKVIPTRAATPGAAVVSIAQVTAHAAHVAAHVKIVAAAKGGAIAAGAVDCIAVDALGVIMAVGDGKEEEARAVVIAATACPRGRAVATDDLAVAQLHDRD